MTSYGLQHPGALWNPGWKNKSIRFLIGCRKKRLNQALSVFSLGLSFFCVCFALSAACCVALFYVDLCSVFPLFSLGCQYRCKWLTGKTCLWNDLSLCVDDDVKLLCSFLNYTIYCMLHNASIMVRLLSHRCVYFKKGKGVELYSAFIEVPYTQGAQIRITQCYLQITPYLPLPRKHSPDGASQTEVADI